MERVRRVVRFFDLFSAETEQQYAGDHDNDAPEELHRHWLTEKYPGGEDHQYRIAVRYRHGETYADLTDGDEVKEVSKQITGRDAGKQIEIDQR